MTALFLARMDHFKQCIKIRENVSFSDKNIPRKGLAPSKFHPGQILHIKVQKLPGGDTLRARGCPARMGAPPPSALGSAISSPSGIPAGAPAENEFGAL